MKTRIFSVLLIVIGLSFNALSQEQQSLGRPARSADTTQPVLSDQEPGIRSLFGNSGKRSSFGFYIAGTTGYSQIDGKDAVQLGGRVGMVIDHYFVMGIAGTSFISNIHRDFDLNPSASSYSIGGGYGGIFFEPVIAPKSPVHIAFPILLGVGGAAIAEPHHHDDWDWEDEDHHEWRNYTTTPFFVVEPGVELELNIVKYLRLAFNASYRATSDLHLRYTSDDGLTTFKAPKDALNGFSGGMTLKLGIF